MKDIENILQIAGNEKKEKLKIPLRIENEIQNTINNIDKNKRKNSIKKLFQTIIWIIITMVCSTGVCWATIQIYNEYIKKQGTTQSNLFINWEDGNFEDLTRIMTYDTENHQYYKIINNFGDYTKFKKTINNLPEMTSQDFETDFLLVITWTEKRLIHETDLEVVEVKSDNTTTNIILNQKENPNYDLKDNIIFAVISNEELRDNIKIKIEHHQIESKGCISIDELTENYTVEQAIQDGCVVVEKTILKSEDPYAIDKFIEKTENGENSFIRIYDKQSKSTYIHDIEYNDGVYYERTKDIMNVDKINYFNSYEKLLKIDSPLGKEYFHYAKSIRTKDTEYLPRNCF